LDIQEAIVQIEKYTTQGRDTFAHNELIQTWVIHHLQRYSNAMRGVEIMEVSRNMTGGNLSDPTISDEAIEGLRQRLGPLDPHQIAAWQAMNPVRRLELAFQAYQFALDVVRLTERQRSADLPSDEFAWRVTRRMQGNPHLGR
jgi:hypothetical protein